MLIDVMQKNFTHPVHEEITNLIFGCDAAPEACVDPEIGFTPPSVQAGVRWNDDPPFRLDATGIPECHSDQTIRLVTQPVCWYKLFRHAEKRAARTYLEQLLPMQLPYDHAHDRGWALGLKVRKVRPEVCTHSYDQGSTIDVAPPAGQRTEAVKLPWYQRLSVYRYRMANQTRRLVHGVATYLRHIGAR